MSTYRNGGSWLAWAAFVLVTVAGCTCGPQGKAEEANRYCTELAELRCDHEIACGRMSAEHRDFCIQQRDEAWPCNGLVDRVRWQYSELDGEVAARCLDRARSAVGQCRYTDVIFASSAAAGFLGDSKFPLCGTSPSPVPSAPSCGQEAIPLSEPDEACLADEDCADPAYGCGGEGCRKTCRKAGVLDGPCRGGCELGLFCDVPTRTCRQGAAVGEACGFEAGCDTTAGFCLRDSEASFEGHCQAWGAEGEPCPAVGCFPGLQCRELEQDGPAVCARPAQESDYCRLDRNCEGDLVCLAQVCVRPKGEGESCTWHSGCGPGLFCSGTTCVRRGGAGAPCVSRGERDHFACVQCELGLDCDTVLGTCEAPRVGEAGGECTASTLTCPDDQVCRGASAAGDGGAAVLGRCEPKALGDPCDLDWDCPNASYCQAGADGGAGTCAPASDGTRCFDDEHCQPEHYCEAHKECRTPRGLGEACDQFGSLRCASPLLCVPRGSGSLCLPISSAGEPCDDATHGPCEWPLACVGGTCIEAGYPGQPCLGDGGCAKGTCEAGQCGNGWPSGHECAWSSECASGYCDRGACHDACG